MPRTSHGVFYSLLNVISKDAQKDDCRSRSQKQQWIRDGKRSPCDEHTVLCGEPC